MEMLIDISAKNNITFVMVTHDPELAKKAKRVITLKDGKVIADTRDGVSLMEEDLAIAKEDSDADKNKNTDETIKSEKNAEKTVASEKLEENNER